MGRLTHRGYYQGMSKNKGRPGKDARLVIGAVIIKHKLCLSDEETVAQIQENPYLQYFAGLPGFTNEPPFAPSLFVEIRKRMGQAVFESFHPLPAREVRSTRRVVPGRRRRVRGAVVAQGPQVPERAKGVCKRIRYAVEPFVGAVVAGFPTRKSGAGADAGRPGHRRTCRHIWSAPRGKRKSLSD